MIARTISNMPEISAAELLPGSLFEVSQARPAGEEGRSRYTSRKIKFGELRDRLSDAALEHVRAELNIGATDFRAQLEAPLSALISGDAELSGTKSFAERPVVAAPTAALSAGSLVTAADVEDMIEEQSGFVSNRSKIDCKPDNSSGYTHTEPGDGLMQWHIDDGQRDSSRYVPGSAGAAEAGYVRCAATGQLVVYGWCADNGNMLPEECWVGLFGKLVCGAAGQTQEVQDVALQVQPWVVGRNSQLMQYVSFSLPVKEGMELKIMTGFNVNGQNSGFGDSGSGGNLMLKPNLPNTFVGYIIHD